MHHNNVDHNNKIVNKPINTHVSKDTIVQSNGSNKRKTKFSPSTVKKMGSNQRKKKNLNQEVGENHRRRKRNTTANSKNKVNTILNFNGANFDSNNRHSVNPPSPQAYIKRPAGNNNTPPLPMYHVQYGKNFRAQNDKNDTFYTSSSPLGKDQENTLLEESVTQVEKAAQEVMGNVKVLQAEVDELQAKVNSEKRSAKLKREQIKKLNMDVQEKRHTLHEWIEASNEISKKTAILRNVKQRIKIETSEAYLEKQHGRLMREVREVQSERQRAMTALDLACSIIRHKKRDIIMFRHLGEELEVLTAELDSFQIPPTILPHGPQYFQSQHRHSNHLNDIRTSLRNNAGRSGALDRSNERKVVVKHHPKNQNKMHNTRRRY